jgi:hypothetical protein
MFGMTYSFTDEPFYVLYAGLESAALLALLPELDFWRERYMSAVRHADSYEVKRPEHDAGVQETLNMAKAAWHARLEDTSEDDTREEIRAILDQIDNMKTVLDTDAERSRQRSTTYIRQIGVVLQELLRRRQVAVWILGQRGVLPPNLVE